MVITVRAVKTLGPLLLGGLITLLGTVIVQVFVIPTVQRRMKRVERWQSRYDELTTFVEDDLGRAVERMDQAGRHTRALRESLRRHPAFQLSPSGEAGDEVVAGAVAEITEEAETEERSARHALNDEIDRLRIRVRRLRRAGPSPSYYCNADWSVDRFRAARFIADDTHLGRMSRDEWVVAWDKVDRAREDLLDALERLSGPPGLVRTYRDRLSERLPSGWARVLAWRLSGVVLILAVVLAAAAGG